MPAGKPPLDLMAQVTGANGDTYNWSSKETAVRNRMSGLTISTKRGEGYSQSGCNLSRLIDRDWEDLRLLDSFKVVGVDGSVAYEGRLATDPRSWATDAPTINPQFVGWMGETKRRKFREVFVDRDFSAWGDVPLNRAIQVTGGGISLGDLSYSSSGSGLFSTFPNQALSGSTVGETFYAMPPGCSAAKVMYALAVTSFPVGWLARFLASDADSFAANELYNTGASALTTLNLTTPRRYLIHETSANATAATPAAGANLRISPLGVYGNHGLTTRTNPTATDPDGLYVSDMIANIVQRFCPKLSTAGILTNPYVLAQAAFKERTYPYDAIQFLNALALWEMNVWENQTFNYYPIDLTDYDWEVRAGEQGVEVDLQGDSTEDLANGVAVTFSDVTTGRENEITPETNSLLQDPNVENEANRHGDQLWLEISLSFPATPTDALTLAQAALAEFNQPKAPGTIKVQGHIRDRQGHWQQAWKPRASDRVVITNAVSSITTRPRIINETSYDDESKTLSIACDTQMKRLDAVLDRIGTALAAANLTTV